MIQKLKLIPFFQSPLTRKLLVIFFPFFLCLITELTQMQSISELLHFTATRFGVILFGTLIIAAIFWAITFLCKHAWIGAVFSGVLFFGFACIEYYKYFVSGAHLLISDLKMSKNLGDVAQFAQLHFNFPLVLYFLLLAAYIFCLYLTGFRVNQRFSIRGTASVGISVLTATLILVPTFFAPVSAVFGVDTTYSFNAFGDAERFARNNLISNLLVSINQQTMEQVEQPEGYSAEVMGVFMQKELPEVLAVPPVKPNIITIMSESFGDFRQFPGMEVDEGIYKVFDQVAAQSTQGTTVVPTFGGGTVRTEFELLFGLPVKSLNNAAVPHQLLEQEETEQDTFAQLYKEQGYHTSYVHPFTSTFYGRDVAYANYGFDQMLFLDDLTVEANHFRNNYVDDDTVFRQAEQLMVASKEPDYIHITTMQNHQPYKDADGTGDEVVNYLDGVKLTGESLQGFLERLEALGEPTIVLFVGDHFPFFSPDCDIYTELGIDARNCDELYDQTYLIWGNYDFDADSLPEEKVSAFYLPHLVYRAAGLPESTFVSTMLTAMETDPLYSMAADMEAIDPLLDMITYDRTMGAGYTDEESSLPTP